jgi:tetratricopeptide (TPR) repeat protein
MASELLKLQNRTLALQNVHKGISLFKENRNLEAVVYYNKAISIDELNVDAYVARGALHANEGEFHRAIEDLEYALTLDVNHSNAKTYLKEVFIANAVKYIYFFIIFKN